MNQLSKNLVLERKYSAAARAFIARVIRREIRSGVPFNQAVAIAHSEARRRGYKVPARPNPSLWAQLNPKKRTGRASKKRSKRSLKNPHYKGYRIGATLSGETFIEKGGHHISWANSERDAKRIIDMLTAPAKKKKSSRNPRSVVIGNEAISLSYRGGRGKNKNSRWIHKFETPVQVLGMKDGSIKLKSKDGFKLWDFF